MAAIHLNEPSNITGKDVLRLRRMLGLTQQQLATMLHLSTVTVSRWETGRAAPVGYGDIALQLLTRIAKGHKADVREVTSRLMAAPNRVSVTMEMVRVHDALPAS